MAHLNVLAIAYPVTKTKILPTWITSLAITPWSAIDVEGTISGNVSLNGISQPREIVFLYYRPTGRLMFSTLTDSLGNFTFKTLDRSSKDYYAVSYLKGPFTDPEKYNALIYDLLQPV